MKESKYVEAYRTESAKRTATMTRRVLLGTAAAGSAALLLAGCASADDSNDAEGDELDASSFDEIDEHDGFSSAHQDLASPTPMCGETPENPLGPFYRANAPFRNVIARPVQFEVRGTLRIIDNGRCRRLPNAVIELWHAIPGLAGYYDMTPNSFRGRARIRTDANGEYWFRSVLPPKYPDPNLGLRPRHIHVRTSAGGKELVTQIYFAGDDRLAPDPFDRSELIVPFQRQRRVVNGENRDILVGAFHIVI